MSSDVEDALLRGHDRGQLREDQASDGQEVALALKHAAELGEVRLEPVLLAVLQRRVLQVADHLVDVVLQGGDLPRASTLIDRVRSPFVTAVATSAIARTWVVRFAASWLTLSVRSFQVPAAPGTPA